MSYALSDDELLRKLQTFSHSHEIQNAWFDRIWKAWDWDKNLENLHPVYPSNYRRAIEQDKDKLPQVLRGL